MPLERKIWSGNIFCEYDNDKIIVGQNKNRWYYKILDGNLCEICSHPLTDDTAIGNRCINCFSDDDFSFETTYAMGSYYRRGTALAKDNLSAHILHLKDDKLYSIPLGMALALFVNFCHPNLMKADLIVPVPMHEEKKEMNKFNQTEVVAEVFHSHIPIPINNHCLIKTKNESMVGKNRQERIKAAIDMYKCQEEVKGDVILIDDILTTSTTVNACSRELINNGANKVDVLVLARTIYIEKESEGI
jgi:ComF family protein